MSADFPVSFPLGTPAVGQIPGTGTNDNALAGKSGEYAVVSELNGSATVTITIAAPGVVTWTGHGLVLGNTVTFTTTGALPTGLTASTAYWVIPVDANTFKVATTLANAVAGTAITTSGTQSGVQAGATAVTLSSNTQTNVIGIPLSAGDWDVWGTATFSGNASTTTTLIATSLNTASATLAAPGTTGYAVSIFPAAFAPYGTNPITQSAGPIRVSVPTATIVYLVVLETFSVASSLAYGQLRARRAR